MSQADMKPVRTWREIAEELSIETDSRRLVELSEELDKALEAGQPKRKAAEGNAA